MAKLCMCNADSAMEMVNCYLGSLTRRIGGLLIEQGDGAGQRTLAWLGDGDCYRRRWGAIVVVELVMAV